MTDPFSRLDALAKRLRGPGGCPWDQKQTPESSRRYLVEEAYEAAEAIADDDDRAALEELGDLLFQVVFTANLYEEAGRFGLAECAESAAEKMIRRHPHVFGQAEARTADEVLANWQRIKRTENGDEPVSALGHVPRGLPALMRADRLSRRAAGVGLDWPDAEAVQAKVAEETAELASAAEGGDAGQRAEELGDLLFSLVNLARHWDLEAEAVLQAAGTKFETRFRAVEAEAARQGLELEQLDPEAWDELWEGVKAAERQA